MVLAQKQKYRRMEQDRKTRVSTFPTIIQHSSGRPSYSNQRKKRNKRNPDQKRKLKVSLFVDDRILYIGNPNDSTRKNTRANQLV